ncbi:hypothetical protein ACFL6C_02255 [Myxococcota bacterium]
MKREQERGVDTPLTLSVLRSHVSTHCPDPPVQVLELLSMTSHAKAKQVERQALAKEMRGVDKDTLMAMCRPDKMDGYEPLLHPQTQVNALVDVAADNEIHHNVRNVARRNLINRLADVSMAKS